jgi:hypothetical protein
VSITILLLALAGGALAAFLLLQAVTGGFKNWKLSEKVGAAQVVLPFAAAGFALNAFFGTSVETPSKIVAAVLTVVSGLLAIVKQVAATLEAHPRAEGLGGVGLDEVLSTIARGGR